MPGVFCTKEECVQMADVSIASSAADSSMTSKDDDDIRSGDRHHFRKQQDTNEKRRHQCWTRADAVRHVKKEKKKSKWHDSIHDQRAECFACILDRTARRLLYTVNNSILLVEKKKHLPDVEGLIVQKTKKEVVVAVVVGVEMGWNAEHLVKSRAG